MRDVFPERMLCMCPITCPANHLGGQSVVVRTPNTSPDACRESEQVLHVMPHIPRVLGIGSE